MASHRALVRINGRTNRLPVGDTLDGAGGSSPPTTMSVDYTVSGQVLVKRRIRIRNGTVLHIRADSYLGHLR